MGVGGTVVLDCLSSPEGTAMNGCTHSQGSLDGFLELRI